MEFVEPKVFLLAPYGEMLQSNAVEAFLAELGAAHWDTDVGNSGEKLIEMAGKACYKSFDTSLNQNLTRVTEYDNKKYIGRSILSNKHGSVLEHVNATIAFVHVSRIFTHELVRHRHGSYSQESLRFVRLTDLEAYYPDVFKEDFLETVKAHLAGKEIDVTDFPTEAQLRHLFSKAFEYAENTQYHLSHLLHLNELDNFHSKKKLTSAMRRLAPMGLGTTVIMTANLRHWRHIIELRTAPGAEEEIRKVFFMVYEQLSDLFPHVFQDAKVIRQDFGWTVEFENSKV